MSFGKRVRERVSKEVLKTLASIGLDDDESIEEYFNAMGFLLSVSGKFKVAEILDYCTEGAPKKVKARVAAAFVLMTFEIQLLNASNR